MLNQYAREQMLFGEEGMKKLKNARVCVFGVGGVGGYVVEALARSGIGTLDIVDNDTVSLSNLNRQIIALHSTIGRYKVDVMEERIHDIDPSIKVNKYTCFYLPETKDQFDFTQYDYVVDAIDTVSGKISIVLQAQEAGTPVICSMGTGNKVDPSQLEITDIYKTEMDPLAKVMRYEMKKRRVKKLTVLFSKEKPITPIPMEQEQLTNKKRSVPGSTAFVPPAAGLMIAAKVVRDILGIKPLK